MSVGRGRADRIGEVRRHDADDLVAPALERNRAADDRRDPPPKRRRHRPSLRTATRWRPSTSFSAVNARPMAGCTRSTSKKPAVTRCDRQILGLGARFAQRERAAGDRGHRLEHLLLGRPVEVVLRRDAAERLRIAVRVGDRSRGRALAHRDEPIVLVERQPAEHDGIDDREDRRARADAQRQDDEGDGREVLDDGRSGGQLSGRHA